MRVWIAIWTGSAAICRHIAAWLLVAPVPRLCLVALTLGFVNGLVSAGTIAAVLAVAWLGVAVVVGLRLPPPATGTAAAGEPAPPADEPPAVVPPPVAEPADPTPHELALALHAVGAPHAHLAAVARHLNTTPDRVRAALKAAGIPAGDQVRMRGRGVSTGVKAAHFPPLPPGDESPAEPSLTSNNNSNNSFDTIPDDTNPVRTHVRWRARRSG